MKSKLASEVEMAELMTAIHAIARHAPAVEADYADEAVGALTKRRLFLALAFLRMAQRHESSRRRWARPIELLEDLVYVVEQ